MRFALRAAGLAVLAFACVLPAFAADDKKPDDKKPDDKKPDLKKVEDKKVEDKAAKEKKDAENKMISAGQVSGKLLRISDGGQKTITVQVKIVYRVPNPGALQTIANLQLQIQQTRLQIQQAAVQRNFQQLQQLQLQLAQQQQQLFQNQANAFQRKEENKDLELKLAEDVEIRVMNLPPAFDDKGQVRKRTRKELDELKGPDKKKPGYQGDMESLHPEQYVVAHLVRKKDAPKLKGGGGLPPVDGLDDNKPTVSMVVIVAEPMVQPNR